MERARVVGLAIVTVCCGCTQRALDVASTTTTSETTEQADEPAVTVGAPTTEHAATTGAPTTSEHDDALGATASGEHDDTLAATTSGEGTTGAELGPDLPDETGTRCGELVIEDPILATIILSHLGLGAGPISAEQAASVEYLHGGGELHTLVGLECLTQLRQLWLVSVDGALTDLGPVAALTELEHFSLYSASVSDLSPLAGLSQLSSLGLHNVPVSDLSPLAALPKLAALDVSNSPIASFEPLAGTPLTFLDGHLLPPAAATTVGNLVQLQHLRLTSSGITDIGQLAPLTGLASLVLQDNAIVDLAPLAGMSALKYLALDNNAVADLAPLAGMGQLQNLGINNNAVADLAPLAGLPGLSELRAADNAIGDLLPLGGLPALIHAYLPGNAITDIGPLATAHQLGFFDVSRNPVTHGFDAFGAHPALIYVALHDVGLTELPVIAPQVLAGIGLSNNEIADITPLQSYVALDSVHLGHNAITSAAPLLGAPWLDENDSIVLEGNPIDPDELAQVLPALCPDVCVWFSEDQHCGVCYEVS